MIQICTFPIFHIQNYSLLVIKSRETTFSYYLKLLNGQYIMLRTLSILRCLHLRIYTYLKPSYRLDAKKSKMVVYLGNKFIEILKSVRFCTILIFFRTQKHSFILLNKII